MHLKYFSDSVRDDFSALIKNARLWLWNRSPNYLKEHFQKSEMGTSFANKKASKALFDVQSLT